MKIGFVHTFYLERGGGDMVIEQEYALLQSNNIEVCLLKFKNPGSRTGKILNALGSFFNVRSFFKVKEWIRKEQPDIIHLHNWHFQGSPSIIRAARQLGVPVVHTLHNYRLLCPSATLFHDKKLFLSSLQKGFPWKAIYYRVYRHSAIQTFLVAFTVWFHRWIGTWQSVEKFIALTPYARELFLSPANGMNLNPEKIVVKSNFASGLSYCEKIKKDRFLFVGRLIEEKGIFTLLDAFKNTEFQLDIIGDGPLRLQVEQAGQDWSNINYLGFRDRAFILDTLKNSTALLCPSIWLEGNPLTIIDSFASGTPVIGSKLGAVGSMIRHGYNGLLFDAGDPNALRAGVASWARHTESQHIQYRQQAHSTYCSMYTPEKNLQQLLSIYKSMLHEKSECLKYTGQHGHIQ